jgi:hypothetical protein
MSDSEDETLGGFIVPDRKRKREEESDSEEETVVDEAEPLPEDENELIKVLQEEAEKIVGQIDGTNVNGRTLRNRTKIQAPVDHYMERFGKRTLAKLAVSEEKREMLDDIKAWRKEFQDATIEWPTVNMKDSIESIRTAHTKVIADLDLDLRDDDDVSEETPEDTEDESEDIEDTEDTEETESEEESSEDEQ